MPYQQTKKDFEDRLHEQHHFLIKSAKAYDRGDISESKRIATHIRTILHDTSKSTSLLNHLGIKNSIKFIDTAGDINNKETSARCDFISLRYEYFSGQSEIVPRLDKHVEIKTVDFNIWWNKLIYYDPATNNKLTRKDLILTLANKDGGAHVDSKIDDQTYIDLTKNGAFGWKATINGNPIDTAKALYAMTRQVAFEIITTLKKSGLV